MLPLLVVLPHGFGLWSVRLSWNGTCSNSCCSSCRTLTYKTPRKGFFARPASKSYTTHPSTCLCYTLLDTIGFKITGECHAMSLAPLFEKIGAIQKPKIQNGVTSFFSTFSVLKSSQSCGTDDPRSKPISGFETRQDETTAEQKQQQQKLQHRKHILGSSCLSFTAPPTQERWSWKLSLAEGSTLAS